MSELTREQVDTLADNCLDVADAIERFRMDSFESLSLEERRDLLQFVIALERQADRLTAEAIRITLDGAAPAVNQLMQTGKKLGDVLASEAKVARVFAIAGAAVQLFASLATGNPEAIFNAVGAAASVLAPQAIG